MLYLIYDGSFPGFLTAVFDAFESKTQEVDFVSKQNHCPSFYDEHMVAFDRDKAGRVYHAITQKLCVSCYDRIFHAWLSHQAGIERDLFLFLKMSFSSGRNLWTMLSHPVISRVSTAARAVEREAELYLGILRFRKAAGIYVADIASKREVLPVIAPHFAKRFGDSPFLVRDLNFFQAFFCAQGKSGFFPMEEFTDLQEISEKDEFEAMWKAYYRSVCIQERKNKKVMQSHMPKYTWKYIIEREDMERSRI